MLWLWSGTVRDDKHTQPFAKSEPEIKIDYFSRRLPQRFIPDCSSSLLFNIFSLHPKDDEQTSTKQQQQQTSKAKILHFETDLIMTKLRKVESISESTR